MKIQRRNLRPFQGLKRTATSQALATAALAQAFAPIGAAARPEPLTILTDGRRHLICLPFTIENLHRMAADLGIGPHWFRGRRLPHYDIPQGREADIDRLIAAGRVRAVRPRDIVAAIRGRA